jgi:uridine kinase
MHEDAGVVEVTLHTQIRAIFIGGVFSRLVLILLFFPVLQLILFEPFLQDFIQSPSLDPWQHWLNGGGRSDAFPYGPIMLVYFAVVDIFMSLVLGSFGHQISIGLGLLFVEMMLWSAAIKFDFKLKKNILVLFTLSPIILIASYIHGQVDLIPTAILFLGLLKLRENNWTGAGLFIGVAAATKFSTLLVLPLVIVFLLRNSHYRGKSIKFAIGLAPGLALTLLPLFLPGYRVMVAETPQKSALFAYSVQIGNDFSVLIAPILISLFAAVVIHFKRANLRMLFIVCSIALSAFPLFMPSSPGWFLWGIPGLLLIASPLHIRYRALVIALGFSEAVFSLLTYSRAVTRQTYVSSTNLDLVNLDLSEMQHWIIDLSLSLTILLGLFTLWKIFTVTFQIEDPFKLSDAPLSIAVAGDSGTGKDTLCASLASVFGESRCTFILGDDYHSFERGASAWLSKTHLDPAANDIDRLTFDSLRILTGEHVWSRHYDHDRGRFTKVRKIKNGDVVAISGLHVLAIEPICRSVDLTVFLDMDNSLRTWLKLKRDIASRNQTPEKILKSLDDRGVDRQEFIQPQMANADLIIRVKAPEVLGAELQRSNEFLSLEVSVEVKGLTFGNALVKNYIALVGGQASIGYNSKPGTTLLNFQSTEWVSRNDIAAIATKMIEHPEDLFIKNPAWEDGSKGISQLIMILALLEKRNINSWKAKVV